VSEVLEQRVEWVVPHECCVPGHSNALFGGVFENGNVKRVERASFAGQRSAKEKIRIRFGADVFGRGDLELASRQGSGLIGANDARGAQRLNSHEATNEGILTGQAPGSETEIESKDDWELFWHRGNRKTDSGEKGVRKAFSVEQLDDDQRDTKETGEETKALD
jgi:hypothetical protein